MNAPGSPLAFTKTCNISKKNTDAFKKFSALLGNLSGVLGRLMLLPSIGHHLHERQQGNRRSWKYHHLLKTQFFSPAAFMWPSCNRNQTGLFSAKHNQMLDDEKASPCRPILKS